MTKYKYLFSLNALIYLSLPIFALFPEMTSYIFRVAPFEGSRLDSFQNLMFQNLFRFNPKPKPKNLLILVLLLAVVQVI